MKKLRSKMTYANVISTIALFFVLAGGSAFAAKEALLPKNSVGAKQLQPGAVTPAKLSAGSKTALTGAMGPKGDTGLAGAQGSKGDNGAEGPEGPQGLPGTTGVEGLVVDAESGEATQRSGPVALNGETSWTTGSGQAGLLFGELVATLAVTQEGREMLFSCSVTITVFDNGTEVGRVSTGTLERSFATKTAKLTPPIAIAFHQPGAHLITATVASNSSCETGTKIDNVSLAVAPLG